jgi:hypothetical protein
VSTIGRKEYSLKHGRVGLPFYTNYSHFPKSFSSVSSACTRNLQIWMRRQYEIQINWPNRVLLHSLYFGWKARCFNQNNKYSYSMPSPSYTSDACHASNKLVSLRAEFLFLCNLIIIYYEKYVVYNLSRQILTILQVRKLGRIWWFCLKSDKQSQITPINVNVMEQASWAITYMPSRYTLYEPRFGYGLSWMKRLWFCTVPPRDCKANHWNRPQPFSPKSFTFHWSPT